VNKEQLQNIRHLVVDCDGVLTDGKFWVDSDGNIMKGFNCLDVRAIREFLANGWTVDIITASTWKGMVSFGRKTGANVIVLRDKSLYESKEPFIAIIDDAWDIPLMDKPVHVFFPYQSYLSQYTPANFSKWDLLTVTGGGGVIAELAKVLL
jgi:3-deoxy-D-manno-octulosonate 8-phosphate phosphatase KdsC-like HAD superfamily phosphatase